MLRSVLRTTNSAKLSYRTLNFSTEVKKTAEEIREETLSNLSYAKRKEVEFMNEPQIFNHHVKSTTPLIKELFLGRLGVEMFSFPELENKEAVDDLDMMYDQVKKFMLSIDSAVIDRNSQIPKDVLQGVADLGLFGQQIDPAFGGLGLNATQTSRLAEATTLDPSIAVTLAAHQSIGLKGILLVGTEEQKQKYLPKLASGEHVAAFCLSEPSSGSDVQSIRTKAELDPSGKFWLINGGKCWISNGSMAQIMTVFAKTKMTNDQNQVQEKITAFIVDRDFGGVKPLKPEDKLGIRGSNTVEVMFENVKVPVENVLGEVGGGFKLALRILNSGRFAMGASGAGILRYLLAYATEHALSRIQFGQPIGQYGAIRKKLAEIACDIYAMESMAYLVAGLLDANPTRDLSLEAAAIKIFSSEACWRGASECLQVTGGVGFTKSLPFERYLRDARIMMIFEGTNEILRLLIGGSGLGYAGKELQHLLRKVKDPRYALPMMLKHNVQYLRQKALLSPPVGFLPTDRAAVNEESLQLPNLVPLKDHLHPQLEKTANELAKYILDFKSLTRSMLRLHGRNLVNQQIDVMRAADFAIDIFMIASCLSRCNRSLAIGLPRAEHEVDIVRTLAANAFCRLDTLLKLRSDQLSRYESIADTVLSERGYAAVHPLTRVW